MGNNFGMLVFCLALLLAVVGPVWLWWRVTVKSRRPCDLCGEVGPAAALLLSRRFGWAVLHGLVPDLSPAVLSMARGGNAPVRHRDDRVREWVQHALEGKTLLKRLCKKCAERRAQAIRLTEPLPCCGPCQDATFRRTGMVRTFVGLFAVEEKRPLGEHDSRVVTVVGDACNVVKLRLCWSCTIRVSRLLIVIVTALFLICVPGALALLAMAENRPMSPYVVFGTLAIGLVGALCVLGIEVIPRATDRYLRSVCTQRPNPSGLTFFSQQDWLDFEWRLNRVPNVQGRTQTATEGPLCCRCGSVLEVTDVARGAQVFGRALPRLFLGVVCEACGKVECARCKGSPVDAPCSFCGGPVQPAYERTPDDAEIPALASPESPQPGETTKDTTILAPDAAFLSSDFSELESAAGLGQSGLEVGIDAWNEQQFSLAEDALQQAVTVGLAPTHRAHAFQMLGQCALRRGDLHAAVAQFVKTLQCEKRTADAAWEAASRLAVVYAEAQQKEAAEAVSQLAAAANRRGLYLEPDHVDHIRELVRARRRLMANETDHVETLVRLCQAYADNDTAAIARLEPEATRIGRELHKQHGIEAMRRVYSQVPDMPGKRTLEMHWDGIGNWRG
jgi:hypothetical protein